MLYSKIEKQTNRSHLKRRDPIWRLTKLDAAVHAARPALNNRK
jgi:hypothetical protein